METITIKGQAVPKLGFGTWQITGPACLEAVGMALDIGYRHIDTAQIYGNEREVGEALVNSDIPREQIFVTTKLWRDRLAHDQVLADAEESLRRLKTDYVDLLLIHWPNDAFVLERTLDAMMQLQEKGKVRLIGVSNFPPSLYKRALEHAPIATNQVEYHPYLGQERLRAMAEATGGFLTAYSPLAQGKAPNDETLRAIGEAYGKTPSQVALRWLLQQPAVVPIPKSTSRDHARRNFEVFDFTLTTEEMQRVSALARGERMADPDFAPDWNA